MTWNRNLFLKNIKSLRKLNGWTLSDLEQRCPSVYDGYLAKLNTAGNENRPTVDYVAEIAEACGVSIDALLNVDFSEMRENAIFVTKFLDMLMKSTYQQYSMWQEISLAELISGKNLKAVTVTAEDLNEDFYYTDAYGDVLENSDKGYIRLFAEDENRPDGLTYNSLSDGNQVTFASQYYTAQCEFAGSVYRLRSSRWDYFYLLKLQHLDNIVYEIYYCNEIGVEGVEDKYFYSIARDTDPVLNSEFDSVGDKIKILYNLVDEQIHHPVLPQTKRERVLKLVQF